MRRLYLIGGGLAAGLGVAACGGGSFSMPSGRSGPPAAYCAAVQQLRNDLNQAANGTTPASTYQDGYNVGVQAEVAGQPWAGEAQQFASFANGQDDVGAMGELALMARGC